MSVHWRVCARGSAARVSVGPPRSSPPTWRLVLHCRRRRKPTCSSIRCVSTVVVRRGRKWAYGEYHKFAGPLLRHPSDHAPFLLLPVFLLLLLRRAQAILRLDPDPPPALQLLQTEQSVGCKRQLPDLRLPRGHRQRDQAACPALEHRLLHGRMEQHGLARHKNGGPKFQHEPAH